MDHWSPRRSRPTSFAHRRGSRRPSSPEFERAPFKKSSDRFESRKKNEWPVGNKSGFRDRSRSPLGDHGNFRGRSDRGRPFRGRSDREQSFREGSDRGRPLRERSDREQSFREGSDRGRTFRGRSDREQSFRDGSDRGRTFRGRSDREQSFREGSDRGRSSDGGRPFRGGSDRGRSFRGTSDRGRSFRGRVFRGVSDRGGSDRGRSFRGRVFRGVSDRGGSDRGRSFRGRLYRGVSDRTGPDRDSHYRERSFSRGSNESFQEKLSDQRREPRSRSNSIDRYYPIDSENDGHSDEELIHTNMPRSRSNSRERLYGKESIEIRRYIGGDPLRDNIQLRVSRSRSNSRSRYVKESGEHREFKQNQPRFQPRKSRSRSSSRDRLFSTGHKVYYDQPFEAKNDYQLRNTRSRSNSRDRPYTGGSIQNKVHSAEFESQPRVFRSRRLSTDSLGRLDAPRFVRDDIGLEDPNKRLLIEPIYPLESYNYNLSSGLGGGTEIIFKPEKSYTSTADFIQGSSYDGERFIQNKIYESKPKEVYDSKPKVYRLSSNFVDDFKEETHQFKNYPSRESDHQRNFSSSFINPSSPPLLKRSFENEYYERKLKEERPTISTNELNSPSRFTNQKREFHVVDDFKANQKRSYQDSFIEKSGSRQQRTWPQDPIKNKQILPRKQFGSDDNEDIKPRFQNRTWHRGSLKNKDTASTEDLKELNHVIIFFDFNSSSINRNLWAVLFNSFRACDLWLNCIENCYQDDYKNMYYCILKWKFQELVKAEDVQPVVAKQKAGFMLINELAQTNYTIKARPEYFCCSLETLKQKYEPQGICRFVKHEEARGVVSGFKLIEDEFEKDKHVELVFGGTEHKPSYLDGIKKYADNLNLKYRFLAENFLSVSFNFSPEYIKRDLLEKGRLADKFELIPPLGPGVRLLDDHNLTGFLPNTTKFFQGTHITKVKKCKNFIGKLKTLEKRSSFAKATNLLKDGGDREMAKEIIDTLPPRKKRKLTNKLLRLPTSH